MLLGRLARSPLLHLTLASASSCSVLVFEAVSSSSLEEYSSILDFAASEPDEREAEVVSQKHMNLEEVNSGGLVAGLWVSATHTLTSNVDYQKKTGRVKRYPMKGGVIVKIEYDV